MAYKNRLVSAGERRDRGALHALAHRGVSNEAVRLHVFDEAGEEGSGIATRDYDVPTACQRLVKWPSSRRMPSRHAGLVLP